MQSFIPPEWAPHKAIWTAWPAHRDWGAYLDEARAEVAAMVRLLSLGENMKVLANPGEAWEDAHQALQDVAEVIDAPYGDIWLRDTGPLFGAIYAENQSARAVVPDAAAAGDAVAVARSEHSEQSAEQSHQNIRGRMAQKQIAHRFRFNGWGGKFVYEGDEAVGGIIAARTSTKTTRHDFILEGGSLDFDGDGLCLTTKQCLLNENRNPGWTQEIAEQKLKETLGFEKILWLDEGLAGDHTDGHIDNIARFVAPGRVVCMAANGDDDPNAKVLKRIEDALRGMTDVSGKPLEVVTVPSPGLFMADNAVQAASHMNFIIGNKTVVVPAYNKHADAAVATLKPLFPGREIVHASARALVTGGGSFHCITQQQPE